jgi:hypothetical protein
MRRAWREPKLLSALASSALGFTTGPAISLPREAVLKIASIFVPQRWQRAARTPSHEPLTAALERSKDGVANAASLAGSRQCAVLAPGRARAEFPASRTLSPSARLSEGGSDLIV